MSCPVCIESFNRSKRKPVRCLNRDCDFVACRVCYKRYLVSTIEEAHCMACKQTWDVHFLYSQFTRKFVNDTWWVHRVRCMVNHEKSLLPNAMHYVKMINRVYVLRSNINHLQYELNQLKREYSTLTDKEARKHLRKITKEKREQKRKYSSEFLQNVFRNDPEFQKRFFVPRNVDDSIAYVYQLGDKKRPQTTERFTWPCPQTKCRGFLDSKFYCHLCHTHVCSRCHAIKGKGEDDDTKYNHTCKEDDIKSVAQKKRNTCSCPNCNVLIYRISGCDQMWCTQCFTPFDFKTRTIITGRIHNPHYFDHLFSEGKDPDRNHPVPNNPGCNFHTKLVMRIFQDNQFGFFKSICYSIYHYQDGIVREYIHNRDSIDYRISNMVLRVKYLMHRISEAEWLKQIKTNERHRLFFTAVIPVYVTWFEACFDYLMKIQQIYTYRRALLEGHTENPHEYVLEYDQSEFSLEMHLKHQKAEDDQKANTDMNNLLDNDHYTKSIRDQIIQIVELTRITNEHLHRIMSHYHQSCVLIDLNNYVYANRSISITEEERDVNTYIHMYIDPIKHRKKPNLKEKTLDNLKRVIYEHPSSTFCWKDISTSDIPDPY